MSTRAKVQRTVAAACLSLSVALLGYVAVSPDTAPDVVAVPAPVVAAVDGTPSLTPDTAPTPVVSPSPVARTPKPKAKADPKPKAPADLGGRVVPAVPTGLEIPALGVDTRIVTTSTVDGYFQVPDNIQHVGWDQGTLKPGARKGTALMAGHLDDAYGNDGALHDLLTLEPGDQMTVETRRGDITYEVTSVRNYLKDGLPVEIVARDGKHQVALVTCGGPLERGDDGLLHYRDNIVVWASPVGR